MLYLHGFRQLKLDIPIQLLADSQSGIRLAENPILHQRSKHIDVHYHYTQEPLLAESFTLDYVPTSADIADIVTKGLTRETHEKLAHRLMLIEREC